MDIENILEIPNFFSNEDFKKIWAYHDKPMWKYGHSSNNAESIRFWQMELSKDEYFLHYLYEKILNVIDEEYVLEIVYANGHTYGTHGAPHHDSLNSFDRTALYYANSVWDFTCGGKTAFNLNGKHHFILPEPNKLVIFPGLIPHWAEETSRIFMGLRMTIAWKLKNKSQHIDK